MLAAAIKKKRKGKGSIRMFYTRNIHIFIHTHTYIVQRSLPPRDPSNWAT